MRINGEYLGKWDLINFADTNGNTQYVFRHFTLNIEESYGLMEVNGTVYEVHGKGIDIPSFSETLHYERYLNKTAINVLLNANSLEDLPTN